VRKRFDIGQAKLYELRNSEGARFGDVAERCAANITVVRSVRQGANADTVQDNPNHAGKGRHFRNPSKLLVQRNTVRMAQSWVAKARGGQGSIWAKL